MDRGLTRRSHLIIGACGLLGVALLGFAFRDVVWGRAQSALNNLSIGIVAGVLALSTASFATQIARWRLFVRAAGHDVPWNAIAAYRLAAWGINYVTPGVQVGGEILRVVALERNQRVHRSDAVMSVLLDKIVELAASVSVLLGSLLLTGSARLFQAGGGIALGVWVGVVAAPVGTAVAIARGHRPLSRLTALVLRMVGSSSGERSASVRTSRPVRAIIRGEMSVAKLLKDTRGIAIQALALSALYWLLLLAEYALICRAFDARLSPLQLLAALAVTHIALQLAPVPGGIGALEASHVAVFSFFNAPLSAALMVAVFVRGRDALFAAVGLWCAAHSMPRLTSIAAGRQASGAARS